MTNPKMTDKMPTEGHFVAVWYNNGRVWADTHRYKDGKLQVFTDRDDWVDTNCSEFYEKKEARFIV